MTFWTTPTGEKISFKEFINRWKEGIKKATLTISPQKQNKSTIKFTWIMLIGFITGFVMGIINWKTLWWVVIVLFAAIGNTLIQLIALYQQKKVLENYESFEDIFDNHSAKENDIELEGGIKI